MMNNQWQRFLSQHGASWDEAGYQTHFANPPADRPWLSDLSYLGLLSCQGEGAEKFLQGQLTCHLGQITPSQTSLGGLCTPKGALLSLFRINRHDQGYLLGMPADTLASTLQTLNKYIVFFKAKLSDVSAEWVRLGLQGQGADNILLALFDDCPTQDHQQLAIAGGYLIRVPGQQPRFELWLQTEAAIQLWPALMEHASFAASQLWERSEIDAGLPWLPAALMESYIPQMLNLQALGGVNFKKGCYTGQEIVARMQYRGSLKRCLFIAEVNSQVPLSLGMQIDGERANLGQVVRFVELSPGHYRLLAVLYKEEAESQTLYISGQPQASLTLLPLPYTIDPEVFERKVPKL